MTYDKEELKAVFNLKRIKIRGDNLMSSCPFKENHDDDYPSFGINMETGQYNCFACGERGENIRTLAYKLHILLPDDLIKRSLRKIKTTKKQKTIAYIDWEKLPTGDSKEAVKELGKRGISAEVVRKFNVFKTDDGSIVFPCYWGENLLTGFVKRNSKWDGRYGYFPEKVHREFLLFGIESEDNNELFLVESMTDCLKLKSFGVNAISTCGNMIFPGQAKRIIDIAKKLTLVPQRDVPARRWIIDAEDRFKGQIPVFGITIDKEFKDVGQVDYKISQWKIDSQTKKFLF